MQEISHFAAADLSGAAPRSPFAGFLIGGSENVGTGQCAAGTGSGKQLRRWPLPESAAAAALRLYAQTPDEPE